MVSQSYSDGVSEKGQYKSVFTTNSTYQEDLWGNYFEWQGGIDTEIAIQKLHYNT